MSTVLITGVAGFIGSHLAERLLTDGHTIIGMDNFDPFYDVAIKRRNLETSLRNKQFTFFESDIRDAGELDRIFSSHPVNTVVHLAAKAGVRSSLEHPVEYADVNVNGTLTLLEAMRKADVGKMLFASSSSVYGNQKKVPFSENDPVDKPISPYAATKRASELLCHTYHSAHGMDIWCLRFFTVYGPRQRPEMAIAKFLSSARNGKSITVYGDGSMQRDFTYISDIVDGVVSALEYVKGYEVINIGGSKAYMLSELVETIQHITGKELLVTHSPVPRGDVSLTFADTTKANRLFNYQAQTSLSSGLRQQWRAVT